jgi:hypothetical protein
MTQGQITNIGKLQNHRPGSRLADISKVQGLKKILDQDFDSWSNFDNWITNKPAAQFIFSRAMQAHKGSKVDVRCDCCDYVGLAPEDLKIKNKGLSCYGSKVSYMIYKLLDEIKVAPNYKEMSPEDFV